MVEFFCSQRGKETSGKLFNGPMSLVKAAQCTLHEADVGALVNPIQGQADRLKRIRSPNERCPGGECKPSCAKHRVPEDAESQDLTDPDRKKIHEVSSHRERFKESLATAERWAHKNMKSELKH